MAVARTYKVALRCNEETDEYGNVTEVWVPLYTHPMPAGVIEYKILSELEGGEVHTLFVATDASVFDAFGEDAERIV